MPATEFSGLLLHKRPSKARRFGGGEGYIVREAKTKEKEIALLADGFDYVEDSGGVRTEFVFEN